MRTAHPCRVPSPVKPTSSSEQKGNEGTGGDPKQKKNDVLRETVAKPKQPEQVS